MALIAQMVRPLGMNPKVGVRVSLRSRHFLSQSLPHCHKNIRSGVENRCCCLCTGNISYDSFTQNTYLCPHFNRSDVFMSAMASQITSLTIIYSTIYSRRRSKKTSKLRVTGLCEGSSPVTGEFLAQRASNAESVSMWWRHHVSNYTPLKNIK